MTNALSANEDRPIKLPPTWQCVVNGQAQTSGTLFELRDFNWSGLREASVTPPSSYLELTRIRAEGKYEKGVNSHWQSLGNVRYHPAGEEFHCRWYEEKQTVVFCAFNPALALGFDADIDPAYFTKTYDLKNQRLLQLLARAMDELKNPGLASDVVLEALGSAVLDEWKNEFGEYLGAPAHRNRGEQIGKAELEQIIARAREQRIPPKIVDLAAEYGVSVRHFNRLFKQAAGENIAQVFKRERLNRATDLLNNSNLLVKEVAYLCGFHTSASFCKSFRAGLGIAPEAYRQLSSANRCRAITKPHSGTTY